MTWDFVYVEVSHVIENQTHVPFLYRKQHSQKMQMTLHYYKTGIVRHYTYSFSFHIKSAPDTGEKPHLESIFDSVMFSDVNLLWITVTTPQYRYLEIVFLKVRWHAPEINALKKQKKNKEYIFESPL